MNYPENLKDLVSPIKKELTIIVLLAVLGSLSILIAPIAVSKAAGNIMGGNAKYFVIWIVAGGLGLALRQMLHAASLGYAHEVEAKFRYRLRKDFSDKLGRLPLGFFSEMPSGAVRKFISEDTIKVHTIIAHTFSELSASITLPLGCAVVMLVVEWRTALMILGAIMLLLIIGMVWMSVKNRNMGDVNTRYEQAQREMSHSAIEMVDGIKEIKNFGLSGSLFKRFDESVKSFSTISFEWLNTSAGAMTFVLSIIQPAVTLFISLGICLFSIQKGFIMPAEAILFMLLGIIFPSPLLSLMQIGNNIKDGKHSVDNLLKLYAEEDQIYTEAPAAFNAGDIEFKDVSFAYDEQHPVLKNISCRMKKGTVTALVGPSGGGKTTMARLIARFWDVQKGEVCIGGVNVKELAEKDLLSGISLVFQDISLMGAGIAENIALAKPNAGRDEIIKAAKAARIHERIMALPKGYDAVYGEDNVVLSGGEQQRLTIARAFLADAPIVLLDEATAQADAESEVEIQKALSRLSKDKTVVVIAHRLSSIVNADQILLIEGGEIKQQGKHKDLVKTEGTYRSMWQAQNSLGGGE